MGPNSGFCHVSRVVQNCDVIDRWHSCTGCIGGLSGSGVIGSRIHRWY